MIKGNALEVASAYARGELLKQYKIDVTPYSKLDIDSIVALLKLSQMSDIMGEIIS